MRQGFLKKYTALLTAIGLTLTVGGSLYAFEVKPRLEKTIDEKIQACKIVTDIEDGKKHKAINEKLELIENRAMKAEISAWVKLSKKERDEANDLYKALGGK
jgi:hypothetical protein